MAECVCDYGLVIRTSKTLERILEDRYGAEGRGLHEKATSVEHKLSPEVVKKLRFLASTRNNLLHENDSDTLDDREGFIRASSAAEQSLDAQASGQSKVAAKRNSAPRNSFMRDLQKSRNLFFPREMLPLAALVVFGLISVIAVNLVSALWEYREDISELVRGSAPGIIVAIFFTFLVTVIWRTRNR